MATLAFSTGIVIYTCSRTVSSESVYASGTFRLDFVTSVCSWTQFEEPVSTCQELLVGNLLRVFVQELGRGACLCSGTFETEFVTMTLNTGISLYGDD